MILTEAWRHYESDKRLEGYSQHTLKAYTIQCRLMVKEFGDIPVEEVRLEQLKAYLSKEAGRLKPSSIGHRVRFFKSLFRWALDEGYITRNPAAKLREPKQGKRVPKALTEEDLELLRGACTTPYEHALIEFIYTTGCRIGEVVQLNKNCIDWETRSIVVRGKGDKDREVYFDVKCAIWLRNYLKQRKDSDIALFVTERSPQHRLTIDQARYVVKRVAKRAGVEVNVYPHKLRHSYATHLLNNGAPLEAIQTLLGHADINTTRIYAQLSGERRREIYRRYF